MEKLLPSPSARDMPGQQCLSGSCLSRSCSLPHSADAQTPPCLREEVAVMRVRKGTQSAEGPIYWYFTDSRMRGRHPPDLDCSLLSALKGSAQGRDPHPAGPPEGSTPVAGWGRLYAEPGSRDRRGDVHPHLVAPSLAPEAWCCPQALEWAGRQGSCNTGWAGGGMETWPRCPVAGWDGGKGPCWPRRVQDRSVCGVHTGGSGGSLSQAAHGNERGELRGAATPGQGPGWACHLRGPT